MNSINYDSLTEDEISILSDVLKGYIEKHSKILNKSGIAAQIGCERTNFNKWLLGYRKLPDIYVFELNELIKKLQ